MNVTTVPAQTAKVAADPTAFAVRSLVKSYAGVPVLRGVDLAVAPGEIHALLGANGAGKSTLIKCISGAIAPDGGTIDIGATSYDRLSPTESRDAGVAVIYQELSVAQSLSVAANVFLGDELRWGPFVRVARQRREAERLLAELGVQVDVRARLDTLGVAEAQTIEIVKALRRNPTVLILDEPTAALTEREADRLLDKLRALRAQGIPLLYVTHRLDEVFAIADRVSILRAGEIVYSGTVADSTPDQLVTAIVGREVDTAMRPASGATTQPVLLSVQDLLGPDIGPISLNLHRGEVLGLYGLVGSGRTELLESIYGARTSTGDITLDGHPIKIAGPADAIATGIALVPSDRARKAIFGDLSAETNVTLALSRRLARWSVRRLRRERSAFMSLGDSLHLHPCNPKLDARRFSGGNQQKLVLSRWLHPAMRCRVMLLDEPTQGVDVGARAELYAGIRAFAQAGGAVIVASSEPGELIQLANRVVVLGHGRILAVLDSAEVTEARLIAQAHLAESTGATPLAVLAPR